MSTRNLVDYPVNVKLKISSLCVVTLFVFAYVDIFDFFRKDVLEGALAGKVGAFDMNQTFLLLTTTYVLVPGVMIFLTLVMKPAMNRMVNIVVCERMVAASNTQRRRVGCCLKPVFLPTNVKVMPVSGAPQA